MARMDKQGSATTRSSGRAVARHDTASQGPRYGWLGYDTAERPYDTTSSARTRDLAGGVCHDTIVVL